MSYIYGYNCYLQYNPLQTIRICGATKLPFYPKKIYLLSFMVAHCEFDPS